MKKIFFLLLLVTFGLNSICAVNDIPVVVIIKDTPPDPKTIEPETSAQANNSASYLPVSATISETTLSVYFDMPVGNAVITVYDADNNIVSLEIIDTYTISEMYLPVDSWSGGNYTLEITYGTTILTGEFLLE